MNLDSSQSQQHIPLESLICKDFQRGSCTHDQCKYIHVARGEPTKVKLLQLVLQGKGFITHCTDFLAGKCHRDDCRYVHLNQQEVLVVERYAADKAQEHGLAVATVRKKQVCRDHIAGRCQRGELCRYSHAPPPPIPVVVVNSKSASSSGNPSSQSSTSSTSTSNRVSVMPLALPGAAAASPQQPVTSAAKTQSHTSLGLLHNLLEGFSMSSPPQPSPHGPPRE